MLEEFLIMNVHHVMQKISLLEFSNEENKMKWRLTVLAASLQHRHISSWGEHASGKYRVEDSLETPRIATLLLASMAIQM